MKNIILLVLTLFPVLVLSQTQTENYIKTTTYKEPTATSITNPTALQASQSVTYFDGLGRPVQQVAYQQSGSGKDIVTPIEYDALGRQAKEYLPYVPTTAASLNYNTAALTEVGTFYNTVAYENTTNPFSQKEFEASPLNRVLKQAAPGSDWKLGSGHEIRLDYQANIAADQVKKYLVATALNISGVYMPTVTFSANYAAGELYKTISKDENWVSGNNNTTVEFKNTEGQVILKRTYNENLPHDTYYIYDNYGNLTYVLSPKAEGGITEPVLNDLCYQYRYDFRNRLIEKKLPGKDWEYIVYDKLDRLVLTQDANLRANNKWLFTKYDAFGRSVYTGEYTNTVQTTRADVQTLANDSTTLYESRQTAVLNINNSSINYSNNAFPNSGIDLFTINYYDDYSNIDLAGAASTASYGITPITNAKGLSTCTKVRVLNYFSWITTVNYYDSKERPIYNYAKNAYLDVINTSKTKFDFAGKVMETTNTHQKGSASPISIIDTFTYDNAGRVLTQKQKINSQAEEFIADNTYNELGQLISKGVGGKTTQSRLQTVNFDYNIRGWLKNINNTNNIGADLFAFQINYNNATDPTKSLYNGNISQTFWKTANTDTGLRNYTYSYDALNRLTNAVDDISRYNESLTYDKNGNILNLTRLGNTDEAATQFGQMDNLTYTYDSGNKLINVADSSGSAEGFKNTSIYTYDNNGNMLQDSGKIITSNIFYNHLNLPWLIPFNGKASMTGRTWSASIQYVYDAIGQKVSKNVIKREFQGRQQVTLINSTTEYAGGYIYEDGVLKFFSQPEGYVAYNNGVFDYIYQYKDHLGNVRLSYGDADNNGSVSSAEIVEENNYYPFGMKHKGYNTVSTSTNPVLKLKYNSKELQDELGLNLYDYGARNYDPAIGRWMSIDPLGEKYFGATPYNYVLNSPINSIDPDGMDVYIITGSGRVILALREQEKTTDTMYAVKESSISNISSPNGTKDNTSIFDMTETKGVTVRSGLIGQLVKQRYSDKFGRVHSSIGRQNERNEKDYFKLFKYISDNAFDKEFSLQFFNKGGKDWIELGTYHQNARSPRPDVDDSKITRSYHNHSDTEDNVIVEFGQMGANTDGTFLYTGQYSDFHQTLSNHTSYTKHVYYPKSSRLYTVTEYSVKYVKKVATPEDF
nr:DUF6443 domain-containing protein [uncultured Flavobacterium sp.]